MARKIARSLRKKTALTIGRLPLPNTQIRRFSRVNILPLDPVALSTSGKTKVLDYTVGHLINGQTLTFYQSQYQYWNLLAFTITFYIADTDNLVQMWDQGGSLANLTQTQVTDTHNQPNIYVLHCNAEQQQIDYAASPFIQSWESNPACGKLNQRNKHVSKWLMPKSYYPTRLAFNTVTVNSSIDSSFAGPLYYEPHGFACFWPDCDRYQGTAVNRMFVNLGYRVDCVLQFHDRKPYATDA